MLVMNSCILRTLLCSRQLERTTELSREMAPLKAEFTLILLGVSTCFICLNLPYFVFWCCNMLELSYQIANKEEHISTSYSEHLLIAKTLFCCNYCVNFFLYCFSGTFYKQQLFRVLKCKSKSSKYQYRYRVPRYDRSFRATQSGTTQSGTTVSIHSGTLSAQSSLIPATHL